MKNDKKLILIADDEKEIRDVVGLLLRGEGYEVMAAEDGEEVLALASSEVDLYLLDVNMPRLSGIMAAAELRKKYDAPIVFLTAFSGESDKVMAFSAGADDYIISSFLCVSARYFAEVSMSCRPKRSPRRTDLR